MKKHCKWLDVPADKLDRRIPRKDGAYRCLVPVECPTFPCSITKSYGFTWPMTKCFVTIQIYNECPMKEYETQQV